MAVGMDDDLRKPFRPVELRRSLERFADARLLEPTRSG